MTGTNGDSSASALRVGILGAGKIALDHVEVLHALGHTIAAGCCASRFSPNWRNFALAAPEASFEDGEALLRDPAIDAVVACLPWNVTETWLPRLLGATKPVLIEKPIALSRRTLRAALDVVNGQPDKKFVAFNRRFYRPVQEIKARLENGGLKAAEVVISESVDRLVERYGREIIPHVLAYSSCHILDAALYLLGPMKPIRVYGYIERAYAAPFRSLTGVLETPHGIPVTLSLNADNPVPVGLRFYFDDRTAWVLSPMERLVVYRGYEIAEPTPEIRIRSYLPKPQLESVADSSSKPGFVEQMRAFTCGEGQEIAARPEDSMWLLDLIESIQQLAA